MKRSQALRGLSREHHEALVLARRASASAHDRHSAAARQQRDHLLTRWAVQFEPHFALEEQVLLPALVAAGHGLPAAQAQADHTELRRSSSACAAVNWKRWRPGATRWQPMSGLKNARCFLWQNACSISPF